MTALHATTLDDLRDALAEVEDKKPTQRLMAVINYLGEDDATMKQVAERYRYTSPWLSRWVGLLDRLADEPVEPAVFDDPREGRPSKLSDEQHDQFVEVLHDSLEEVGLDAPAWSVPLARHYLSDSRQSSARKSASSWTTHRILRLMQSESSSKTRRSNRATFRGVH